MDREAPLRFPFDDGGCFGCSPSNPDGLGLEFRRDGDSIRATYTVAERFHGAPGVAHGGIVATILDEFSCAAAVFVGKQRVVTGELTVRYEDACPVAEEVEISARITDESHPRYIVIEGEVRHRGAVVARSRGKFFPRDAPE